MEQRKLDLLSPEVSGALDEMLDTEREEIVTVLSHLPQGKQLECLAMFRSQIGPILRKIEAEFVPDKVRQVFDVVINYRYRGSVHRYALIQFLLHIHEKSALQGDLTPEAVIDFLGSQGEDFHFDGVGDRLFQRIKYSCEADISHRKSG